ncbi:hypothetical protein BGZ76_000039 [Entomortierella beljakovae]|nr:hypothetical protein BGZ76_000039 [Entomortierella beljakovae]
MEPVHPFASTGTPLISSSGPKKPSKGTPISVPTNGRRLSTFSVKSANRALMTGYRDGGSNSSRRKSSITFQGPQSPPFFPHKDDFDVVGTVPGFEKLVEAESLKHNKGKPKSLDPTKVSNDLDHKDYKPAKRKKSDAELNGIDTSAKPSKGRRKSSTSIGPFLSSDNLATQISSSSSLSPPPPTESSIVPTTQQVLTAPGTSFNRLKNISGLGKSTKTSQVSWLQMPLTSLRILPNTEFTAAGMTVQFGVDRISITIRRNSTRVPHVELKQVNYYTTPTHKIFQFSTFNKFIDSSVLAKYYDPIISSDKPSMITLFIDTGASTIQSICQNLKQKGVETKRLTPEAAEEIISATVKHPTSAKVTGQAEETLFVYPFNNSAKSKSIVVKAEDSARLEYEGFLNDTMIEFGLKYVQANAEIKNQDLSGQVYIFNTFFYQRLVAKPMKGSANSYDAIKSWTAKVDIFSKKYVIVPINENLHWYLAIITNPGLLLKRNGSNSSRSNSDEPEAMILSDSSDNPNGDDCSITSSEKMVIDTEPVRDTRASSINVEEKPYIICLDSLGNSHPAVFSVLRSFLQQELLSRKGISTTLTAKEITGKFSSKCPKQDNLWDCGIYLLHYTEVFLRSPKALLNAIVNRTDDKSLWSLNELATKRAKYKDIVISLTEQYRVYQFQWDLVDDIKGKSNDKNVSNNNNTAPIHAGNGVELDNSDEKIQSDKSDKSEETTSNLKVMDYQP